MVRVAIGLAVAVAAVLFVFAIEYTRRLDTSLPAHDLPRNAVVFTGQFDRVEAGLTLLDQDRVERLLITGVNRSAGMSQEHFAQQFSVSEKVKRSLETGYLALGTEATSTIENAIETGCWRRTTGLDGPLLLITSRYHMPRAALALERYLPDTTIWRLSVPPDTQPLAYRSLLLEFLKFIITWVTTPSGSAETQHCAKRRAAWFA